MNRKLLISINPSESTLKENQQQCVDAMNYLAGTLEHSHPDLFSELNNLQAKVTQRLKFKQ